MGRSPKPITIVALPPCSTWSELDELEAKGHLIIRPDIAAGQLESADIVIGPNCWRMDEDHRKYLGLAIKEARMLRYPTKQYRAGQKERDEVRESIGLDSNSDDSVVPIDSDT